MTLPVSVFIIAKNEADRIPHTLASVRGWADEIIVVDSGSADGTPAVAEGFGARVVYRAWEGYGPQKVFAEGLCRNSWVLNLDADEEVSPELAREIAALFVRDEPPCAAYRLRILALYPFQEKLPRFAAGTTQLRLYRRDRAGFKDAYVHDSVVLREGRAGRLKGAVIHRSFRSHAHAVEKINFYTTMQAEDLFRRGKRPSALKILVTPLVAFLKCYFFKKYIFYGLDGFIHAWVYAFSRTLRLAKAREKFQEREHTEPSL